MFELLAPSAHFTVNPGPGILPATNCMYNAMSPRAPCGYTRSCAPDTFLSTVEKE